VFYFSINELLVTDEVDDTYKVIGRDIRIHISNVEWHELKFRIEWNAKKIGKDLGKHRFSVPMSDSRFGLLISAGLHLWLL